MRRASDLTTASSGVDGLLDAVARLAGADGALVWSARGAIAATDGWSVGTEALGELEEWLREREPFVAFEPPDGEPLAALEACSSGFDRFAFVPLEPGRAGMLLGFAAASEPAVDLRALAPVAAEALRAALDRSLDAAQLATVREIVSGVGHDVGTPLNVISGYSEYLLMSGPEDAKGRKEISSILEQTRRVAQMVKQMLDIVRTPPGESEQSRPLASFCNEVLQVAAYALRKAQVRCRLEGSVPDRAMVTGELPLLYQTAFNLVASAARAAGPGGQLVIRPVLREDGAGIEIEATDAAKAPVDLTALGGHAGVASARERAGLELADRVLEAYGGRIEPLHPEASPDGLFVRFGA